MRFGDPSEFAIEAYHEPSAPKGHGFGRMTVFVRNISLGDLSDNHCSLFHSTDQIRQLTDDQTSLWDNSFDNLSEREVFDLIDSDIYLDESDLISDRYRRFDFLTNTGEMFNGSKSFLVCRPEGQTTVLFQLRNNVFGFGTFASNTVRKIATEYVNWFDNEVRAPKSAYFPINPLSPLEKVTESVGTNIEL